MIEKNLEILLKVKLIGNDTIIDKFTALLYKQINCSADSIMKQTNTEGEVLQLRMVKRR